jgi:Macrocin-O-methyltransferase (TylF)
MDFTVYPDTPIARLPPLLRPPALLARNIKTGFRSPPGTPSRPSYVYEADGLATVHFSPFLHDREWSDLYSEMASEWFVGMRADVRWRMWVLTSLARECDVLGGSYAEFGVYRAGCAFMMLASSAIPPSKRLFLFDTFTGFPAESLTESEVAVGLADALADTSIDYVAQRLSKWQSQITLVEGDVFQTLLGLDTGPLAFVHMDLNAAAPTRRAIEYVHPRLEAGAIIVFDDYGETGLEAQRAVVDEFFSEKPETVVALPTRQGLLIKR